MKVNTRIRYGLRMLVAIAQEKSHINTTNLGARMQVSPKYLRKLAGPLEKAGIIKSVQGVYGGYSLNQGPEKITIGTIMSALGERLTITSCLNEKDCPLLDGCLTRPVWVALETTLKKKFMTITLKDILENRLENGWDARQ